MHRLAACKPPALHASRFTLHFRGGAMKTVRFHEHGGPEVLRYEEVPEPTPTPTQVTLRVKAVALNHLDIWLRKGLPGVKVPLPKLGGYGVDGGCADFLCVPEVNCIPIPERLDYPSAAAVPLTFLTAWNMLRRQARLKPGEDVLVMGAGSGGGTAAIQIAKLVGARVIAVASTDEKLAKATALGADAGINYASQDLGQEIRRLTGKRGVDVVFEHVGGTTWEKLIPNIAPGGRLGTCGATAGHDAKRDIRYLFSK